MRELTHQSHVPQAEAFTITSTANFVPTEQVPAVQQLGDVALLAEKVAKPVPGYGSAIVADRITEILEPTDIAA